VIPYRDFTYPLNVFMHILMHEEGGVRYLHYGLFDRDDDSIGTAQERSTELLLARLPSPPARLLDVGLGLGTTLERLTQLGYDAEGITPDQTQISLARMRPVRLTQASFETFQSEPYDLLIFQESSQYIESGALFAKARELAPRALVLDEFATRPLDDVGALRPLGAFISAASANGFRVVEELDLSTRAAPTIDYFRARLSRYRAALIADLGLTGQQVDALIASGERYRDRYRTGLYSYRLLDLRR
jgi:cyclopropane fatty-acyl-phospholipid synthase-like methyltransferase